MENTITKEGDVHIIKLKGNILSDQQGEGVMEAVDKLIEQDLTRFIVDLTDLQFINSSGLSFLLRILTKARRADGEIILTNLPEQLPKLLVITKLNNVFTVAETNEAAMKQIKQ